ncbi:MAG: hypothetical protein V4531_01420 [Actinomycetota bacterium]
MPYGIPALAATIAVALGLVLGGAVAPVSAASAGIPVSAASDSLLVSRDGITFAPTIGGGLFEGAGLLVPGQSVSRSLWIRNPTAAAAALRVSIRNLVSTSTEFAIGVSLTATDSVPGSRPTTRSLSTLGACEVLSSAPSIAAGGTVVLTLTMTMADLRAAAARSSRASLDLLVAMRDAAAGRFSGSACRDNGILLADTGGFRTVAFTGGSVPVPLVVGGGILLGIGICLVLARRRRESESD